MQNKGFISTIAILLILICGFYISFSFVTRHYENKAKEYAVAKSGTQDATNDVYKASLKQFNDSIDKEKVYLTYTYNHVRKMEIGLGLDLKGGMNVVLEISVPDILRTLAVDGQQAKVDAAINAALKEAKPSDKNFVSKFASHFQPGTLRNVFNPKQLDSNLKSNASDSEIESALEKEVDSQVDAAFNIFRTRIDQFGVVAPNIQKLQDKRGQILLELPGVKEPERVTELLQSSANLEFYEVYNYDEVAGALQTLGTQFAAADTVSKNKPQLMALLGGGGYQGSPVIGRVKENDKAMVDSILNSALAKSILPSNFKAVWEVKAQEQPVTDQQGNPVMKANGQPQVVEYWQLVALKGAPQLEGDVITSASTEFDNLQGNMVNMRMNDKGARLWSNITGSNLGRAIAIVLDNKAYSYPRVNSKIDGGSSQITGNFTPEEANDLVNVLKSGRMTAQVDVVSNNVIGPSLGATAITQGLWSFVAAIVLLMIFMIAIYGVIPGLVANLGLILNLFFTLGILASLQAVLTLSGIAGIVLALGMAVDANVLIFERTKEELKAGKKLPAAIADGYGNAFSAIFDSNLTSIITGVILLIFGSGPIKGFATTLIIGLVCSFFTAVFLTRIVMEAATKNGKNAGMSFTTSISRNFLANTSVNFINASKKGMWVWIALIVVSVASLLVRGMNQGIDFSGGRNYVVQFEKDVVPADIKLDLEKQFPGSSVSVISIDNNSKVRVSTNYKIDSDDPGIDNEVTDKLYTGLQKYLTVDGKIMDKQNFTIANEDLGIISIQKVGPSVADDMKRDACWAVSIAIVCMFLYILLRFRNVAFSLGAVAAVAMTAFLIIGFYSVCWGFLPFSMEIDQSFIAAVLTIIGYQINDTVVVFDRVREMMKLYPKEDRLITFNKALNTTLSRTFMTSFSTLLVLLCIFILGGDTIRSFTFAMIFGVIVGTFCSLFVAAPVAYTTLKKSLANKAAAKPATNKGNRRG